MQMVGKNSLDEVTTIFGTICKSMIYLVTTKVMGMNIDKKFMCIYLK